MSDRNKDDKQTSRGDRDHTDDPKRPSQAEGSREAVEANLREKAKGGRAEHDDRSAPAGGRDRTDDPKRPSQAEGERGSAEEDSRKKTQ